MRIEILGSIMEVAMTRKGNGRSQYVVCVSNRGYKASLVTRRIYRSVPDPTASERNLVRVVDESGEDYLYPAPMFVPMDVPQAAERAFRKAS